MRLWVCGFVGFCACVLVLVCLCACALVRLCACVSVLLLECVVVCLREYVFGRLGAWVFAFCLLVCWPSCPCVRSCSLACLPDCLAYQAYLADASLTRVQALVRAPAVRSEEENLRRSRHTLAKAESHSTPRARTSHRTRPTAEPSQACKKEWRAQH